MSVNWYTRILHHSVFQKIFRSMSSIRICFNFFFGIVWRFEHLRYVSNWEIVVCWIAGTLETMKETDCLREKRFGGGVVLIIFPTGKMNSRIFFLEKILYSMLLFPIMPWPVYWTSIYKSVSKKHNIHIYVLLLVFWKEVNRSDSLCSRVAKS